MQTRGWGTSTDWHQAAGWVRGWLKPCLLSAQGWEWRLTGEGREGGALPPPLPLSPLWPQPEQQTPVSSAGTLGPPCPPFHPPTKARLGLSGGWAAPVRVCDSGCGLDLVLRSSQFRRRAASSWLLRPQAAWRPCHACALPWALLGASGCSFVAVRCVCPPAFQPDSPPSCRACGEHLPGDPGEVRPQILWGQLAWFP